MREIEKSYALIKPGRNVIDLVLNGDVVTQPVPEAILRRLAFWGRTMWPCDIALAAKAVREQRRVVLLGHGSVVYVRERLDAAAYKRAAGKE